MITSQLQYYNVLQSIFSAPRTLLSVIVLFVVSLAMVITSDSPELCPSGVVAKHGLPGVSFGLVQAPRSRKLWEGLFC